MRKTSLAVLSALSLLLLASNRAPAQSRLTLNDEDRSTPGAEPARLASAADATGPILRMPAEPAARSRRNGLPALRRRTKTARSAPRRDVRISQVPRNSLPGDLSAEEPESGETATQRTYPRPPLLRDTRDSERLDPPQPPPELTGDDELPDFLLPDGRMPTRYAAPQEAQDDAGEPPVEGAVGDDAALINHPYHGPMADFFLPPRPCEVRDYWTDYCYGGGYGYGHGGWLRSLRCRCKRLGCLFGHCRKGHCGGAACQGDCGCDHRIPAPVPEDEAEEGDVDVLLPPGPLPPRNDLPQVRAIDDDRPPRY